MTATMTTIDHRQGKDFRIDPVTSDDLMAVAYIEAESFSTPWHYDSYRDALTRPYTIFLAAWDGKEVVGYALSWLVADELHILKFAVRESWRRRGCGRRLLEATLNLAITGGAEIAWLEVRPSNQAALKLYEGFEFKRAYFRKQYYTYTGEDALILLRRFNQGAGAS